MQLLRTAITPAEALVIVNEFYKSDIIDQRSKRCVQWSDFIE
jgi:hypothetical protein